MGYCWLPWGFGILISDPISLAEQLLKTIHVLSLQLGRLLRWNDITKFVIKCKSSFAYETTLSSLVKLLLPINEAKFWDLICAKAAKPWLISCTLHSFLKGNIDGFLHLLITRPHFNYFFHFLETNCSVPFFRVLL